jgi:Leucine-rich repeat (LRR) protein
LILNLEGNNIREIRRLAQFSNLRELNLKRNPI